MFGFFSMVVLAALFMFVEIAMLVRLTKRGLSPRKAPWWRRRGDEVVAAYEEVFPGSRLPVFRTLVLWLFVAWLGVYALMLLWKLILTH
jgi:hypothetical protein